MARAKRWASGMSRKERPRLEEVVRRRIRELRAERGLTQEQLCERAGISIDAVSRIEGGTRVPTLDTIERLARAFSVAPVTFLGDKGSVVSEPGPSPRIRRIAWLLDGRPEELQRLAEQLVVALVRAFAAGTRAGEK
jgi:transcriptional regulator with XRE-family HTH domain